METVFLIIVLITICTILILKTREPRNLQEVKQRYEVLRTHIKNNKELVPEKFHVLEDPVVLTGRESGDLGYNSNKGYEIGLCLDGETNDIFHVLLHELSHSTVEEYTHSEQFWQNFSELRDMCSNLGIYQRIPVRKSFCGQYIQD
jgi:predicted metal-dependent hydrolase